MPVQSFELISPDENEKPTLQKMEAVLNRETQMSQSVSPSFLKLVGPNDETLEIPMSVLRVLQQAVDYMIHGKPFSMIPYNQLLSIEEAADFLNVPSSFLTELLETDEMPFVKAGTHRRIQFGDLLEYKKRSSQERQKALAEMLELSQETDTL